MGNHLFIKEKIKELKKKYKSNRFCVGTGKRQVIRWFISYYNNNGKYSGIKEVEFEWIMELKAITEIMEQKKIKIMKIEIVYDNNIQKWEADRVIIL